LPRLFGEAEMDQRRFGVVDRIADHGILVRHKLLPHAFISSTAGSAYSMTSLTIVSISARAYPFKFYRRNVRLGSIPLKTRQLRRRDISDSVCLIGRAEGHDGASAS